jgi:co-chaperonin GroES (HSP10)
MKIKGNIVPLRDNILVSDMAFEMQKTASGLFIPSDNGKTSGIHPRWGKVWAIGPEQTDVKVGEWVCIEHGRWTRTVEVEEGESVLELRMIDNDAILMIADEPPGDVIRAG